MLLETIAQTLWFFLPAMIANMAPILAAYYGWFSVLDKPIDGGMKWRGKRILGENKTNRGFVVAIIFGAVTGMGEYLIQTNVSLPFEPITNFSSAWVTLMFGAWIGLAAISGDAVKSFFKRQFNISSGHSWMPWDQIDIVIGVFVFTTWFVSFTFFHVAIAFIIIGFGMYFVSMIGVMLGIKKSI